MKKSNQINSAVFLFMFLFSGLLFGSGPTSITKIADPSSISSMLGNEPVTYTIVYENKTFFDINDYQIWDSLPAGYKYVSSSDGGTVSGNFNSGYVVNWNIGILAAVGVSSTVSVVVSPWLSYGPVSSNFAVDSEGAISTAIVNQPSPTGTPTCTATPTVTSTYGCMLDDFEDNNTFNNWSGSWYAYEDTRYGSPAAVWPGNGMPVALTAGANNTLYAGWITGTVGSTIYPAIGMKASLSSVFSMQRDLSSCTGIRFYAKGNNKSYNVRIPYLNNLQQSLTNGDEYKVNFAATDTWTLKEIPFSSFTQGGWGITQSASVVLSNAQEIKWETSFLGSDADLKIDEVEIYGCAACPPAINPLATAANTPSNTVTRTQLPIMSTTPTFTPTFTRTVIPTSTINLPITPSTTRTLTITITITSDISPVGTMTATLTIIPIQPADNFNDVPIVVYPAPGDNGGRNTCTDPNGNILVVGLEWNGPCSCYIMIIYRYLSDGTLDVSFGTNGRLACPGPQVHYLWDDSMTIKCDSSGRIIVAGYSDTCGGTCADVIIYRFLSDGTPDNSFGTSQCWRTYDNLAGGNGNDYVYDFDFDSNGKMVCTGKSWNGTEYDAIILRCNADGSPDLSFGPGGCQKISKCCGKKIKCSGGKIYITGWSESADPGCTGGDCKSICVWKYNEDGTPDSTFTTSCYINTSIGHNCCKPRSIVITVGGKIIVTGSVDDGSGCTLACKKMIILVYNADGTLDTTFNGTGILTDVSGTEGTCVIEVDGKIVVCFNRYNGSNSDCVVRRYNMDGSVDTSFNLTGETVYDSGNDDYCYSILRLTICKLILAGHSFHISSGYDMILWDIEDMCPAHTATPSITPTKTATLTHTLTATTTCSNSPTYTLTMTPSQTLTCACLSIISETVTVTPTPTGIITSTATMTPTVFCGFAATPVFSVKMIFDSESNDNAVFNITSNTALSSAPGLIVHPHGLSPNKPDLMFTSTLIPAETMKYKVLYTKQTGYGDVDYVEITYADMCGNSAMVKTQFEKSVISQKDVIVFKNVINPDRGERCRISCRIYGSDHISANIYSITGARINEVLNSDVSGTGWKDAVWDGKNTKGETVASGIYHAVVKCGYYTVKEKIAVVK